MERDKALSRAAALCSRSEHCEADIRHRLARWEVAPADAEAVMARLLQERFVDDERYARAFAHDKFLYNGWGRIKIAAALRQKHIDADAIAQALEQIDAGRYRDTLDRLLRDKWRQVRDREPAAARAAMLRLAASRGFEGEMCYRCVDRIVGGYDDD